MAPQSMIRPLGKFEIFSSSRHDLGFYRRIINTCRYEQTSGLSTSTTSNPSLRQVIEVALARVVLELPGLRIAIADESTTSPSFVTVPSIDIRGNHLEFVSLDHNHDDEGGEFALARFLEREHDKLWPTISSRPPWKLTVIQRAGSSVLDMAFAAHHAITDGGGTARFHAFLLRSLSASSGVPCPAQLSAESGVLDCSAAPPNLSPDMQRLIKLDVSWLYLAKEVFKDTATPWLSGSSSTLWAGAPVNPEPYQTHLRFVVVPPESARALISACRARQMTLTPVLHALVLLCLCRVLPEGEKIPNLIFAADTPMSLRPYMTRPVPAGVDEAAVTVPMVTTHRHTFPASTVSRVLAQDQANIQEKDEELVWTIASEVKSTMAERQATLPRDDIVGLLPYSGDWHQRWLARVGKPRTGTWEISNLGAVPVPLESTEVSAPGIERPWRITRTVFSQGADICGTAFTLSVAGARDGGTLCISINWQEGIVDEELMTRFTREFDAILEQTGRAATKDT